MNNLSIYNLSDSTSQVHFEKDIQVTELGKLFNKKLSIRMGFEVVASRLDVVGEYISIAIKERGVDGGMFGTVFRGESNSLSNIEDPTCNTVWSTLCECIDEMSLNSLISPNSKSPCKLAVTIYDFVKRSRLGYFTDNILYLEKKLKQQYPDLSFSLRIKDDIQYFYFIFKTDEDRQKAIEVYGVENMNNYLWELCKNEDTYGVFSKPLPAPVVKTEPEVIECGEAMGIMRNNLKFYTL